MAITTVTATSSSTTATGTMIIQTCIPGEPTIIEKIVSLFSIKTHLPTLVGVTEGDIDTAVVMNIEVEEEGSIIVMEDSIKAPHSACMSTH